MGINDVILRTREGWTFTVFIDAGDVDYIEWIESPDGERYDPWAKDGLRCLADLCFFPGVLSKIEAVIHAHPDWGWR
jgi:hypothetical protein